MSKQSNKRWKGYVFEGHGIRIICSHWSQHNYYFDLGFEYIGKAHITA